MATLETNLIISFSLVLFFNIVAILTLIYTIFRLRKARHAFDLVSYIADPSIWMVISFISHNIGVVMLFSYRVYLLNRGLEDLLLSFIVIDYFTRTYWVLLFVNLTLFIIAMYSFYKQTTMVEDVFSNFSAPFIWLFVIAFGIIIVGLIGYFVDLNYDILRPVFAIPAFWALYLFYTATTRQKNRTSSATQKARLDIMKQILLLPVYWMLISVSIAVVRFFSEFGTFAYFLPPIIITGSAGILGIILAFLTRSMITIPPRIREHYGISTARFEKIKEFQYTD